MNVHALREASPLEATRLDWTVAEVVSVADGTAVLRSLSGAEFSASILRSPSAFVVPMDAGDQVLVGVGLGIGPVVFGAIGPASRAHRVAATAAESVRLQCGHSSIEMHADGKLLIRGEDVLVRAKGTKRIRAGTVSIN